MKTRLGLFIGVAMLVSLFEVARVLQILPGKLPVAGVIALHVLPLLVFALIHGAMFYGRRGILIFFLISFIVGNIFENLGVATGFPFGRYYYTDMMGPKLFHVPILVGFAYPWMGYLSWTLGRVILGNPAGYWRWPIIVYALCATGSIIFVLSKRVPEVVVDPTGTSWNTSAITGGSVLVSTFLMGAFAVIAWVRLSDQTGEINRL